MNMPSSRNLEQYSAQVSAGSKLCFCTWDCGCSYGPVASDVRGTGPWARHYCYPSPSGRLGVPKFRPPKFFSSTESFAGFPPTPFGGAAEACRDSRARTFYKAFSRLFVEPAHVPCVASLRSDQHEGVKSCTRKTGSSQPCSARALQLAAKRLANRPSWAALSAPAHPPQLAAAWAPALSSVPRRTSPIARPTRAPATKAGFQLNNRTALRRGGSRDATLAVLSRGGGFVLSALRVDRNSSGEGTACSRRS